MPNEQETLEPLIFLASIRTWRWSGWMRLGRALLAALLAASMLQVPPALAVTSTVVWESYGLTDEAAVASGSIFADPSGFVNVTLTWSTVTDGGTFIASNGSDFVSYESGTIGGQDGNVSMGFDNGNYDPDDRILFTATFS